MRAKTMWILIGTVFLCSGCAGVDAAKTDEDAREKGLESIRQACLSDEGENKIEACRKYLRMHPGDPDVEHRLGWLLCKAGKLPEGTAHLRKVCKLKPDDAMVRYHVARALETRDDQDGAVVAYQKCLELKPDCFDALLDLGVP